jgi:hypothetical protein
MYDRKEREADTNFCIMVISILLTVLGLLAVIKGIYFQ